MAIQILINTTDMTKYLASRSLKIDMDTSHWKSCSLTLNAIKINEGVPEEGKTLTVKWLEVGKPDILVFKGVINNKSIKQLSPNLDELTVSLSSNGFRNIPYRRTISETFELPNGEEYIVAGNIVKFLVDTYLVSEGIAYFDNGVISGILEGKLYEDDQEFICMNIGEILDQLSKDSNANWYINSSNILYFVEEYYSFDGESEFDIDTELGFTTDVRNLDLKTDLTNYANKVFFKGDIESDSMDNIQVFSQDNAEIAHMAELDGGSGVYGVSVSNSNITTDIEAQAYCDKELAKRKVKPKSISFDTFDWKDYQVGERHNINIPIIGVHNTTLKPKNYVVESITLSAMGNNILSKKIEMRQLFSDVIGSGSEQVTWQKGKQGIAYFKHLTDSIKKTDSVTKNMIKNHSYAENIRGSVLSTQNFDGNGNHIKLEKEMMTFWDNDTPTAPKMTLGFVDGANGSVPGIVLGAGDGNANNRAYIQKGANGLELIFKYGAGTNQVSGIRLGTDGQIYINGAVYGQMATGDFLLVDSFNSSAQVWNDKLSQMKSDGASYAGKVSQDLDTNANNYLDINGDYGDLTLYYSGNEFFKIYNGIWTATLKAWGHDILTFNHTNDTTYANGIWNFDSTTVTGLKARFG